MTLREIKAAVDKGQPVYWSSLLYQVTKDPKDQYHIICKQNNFAIGLTWTDGTTLNGKESDFFTLNHESTK